MIKNKGFSMVELIIVIAIMAILAGFLAPSLIKYINKSRISTDMQAGRELATAISSVVADDGVRDNAVEHATPHEVSNMDGADFKDEVFKFLRITELNGKSKKDINGDPYVNPEFYYTLDAEKNKVEVYYGGTTADYQIYPKAGSKLISD
ncbi:MAG: type II secretion system GspH family protein [Bacteroidales bacterium]|nr:type II secretion system GspH family protein [Clostridium sp.]MCM1204419.1 type II secretion system GspH family protein [Bacteroidales bacterium]